MTPELKLPLLNDEPRSPLGIRFSAGLLFAFGMLWGLYALLFAGLFCVFGYRLWGNHVANRQDWHWLVGSLIAMAVSGGLTYLCFRAGAALREARRWAAYVAMGFGLLFLLISGDFVYDMFHPERQSADEYFLILVVPFFFAAGAWWCIYLNLPHVRAYFRQDVRR